MTVNGEEGANYYHEPGTGLAYSALDVFASFKHSVWHWLSGTRDQREHDFEVIRPKQ